MADENESGEIIGKGADAVSFENVKVTGGLAAFYGGLQMQQALDASNSWRILNQAIVGKVAEAVIHTSPSQAGGDIAALQELLRPVKPVTTPSS